MVANLSLGSTLKISARSTVGPLKPGPAFAISILIYFYNELAINEYVKDPIVVKFVILWCHFNEFIFVIEGIFQSPGGLSLNSHPPSLVQEKDTLIIFSAPHAA